MPSVVDSGRALNISAQTFEEKAVIGVAVQDHTPYQIQEGTGSQFVLTDPHSKFTPQEVPENIDFLDKGLEGVYVDPLVGYGHSAIQDASAMINQINDILMDSRVMHDPVENLDLGPLGTYTHFDNPPDGPEVYVYTDPDGNQTNTSIMEHDECRTVTTSVSNVDGSSSTSIEIQIQDENGNWLTIGVESWDTFEKASESESTSSSSSETSEADADKKWWQWRNREECFPPVPPPMHLDQSMQGNDPTMLTEMQLMTPVELTKFPLI